MCVCVCTRAIVFMQKLILTCTFLLQFIWRCNCFVVSTNLPMNFFIVAHTHREGESRSNFFIEIETNISLPFSHFICVHYVQIFAGNNTKYCIVHWRIVICETKKTTTTTTHLFCVDDVDDDDEKRNRRNLIPVLGFFFSRRIILHFQCSSRFITTVWLLFLFTLMHFVFMPLSIFFINSPLPFFYICLCQPHSYSIFHLHLFFYRYCEWKCIEKCLLLRTIVRASLGSIVFSLSM